MGLLDQIKLDIQQITSNADEFGVSMTLTAPTGETAVLVGLHTKHHLGFDSESGRDVNFKNSHIAFSEQALIGVNPLYPLRNAKNEVNLSGHRVLAKDSTGVDCEYVINESFPDETIGLITCVLGVYKE